MTADEARNNMKKEENLFSETIINDKIYHDSLMKQNKSTFQLESEEQAKQIKNFYELKGYEVTYDLEIMKITISWK